MSEKTSEDFLKEINELKLSLIEVMKLVENQSDIISNYSHMIESVDSKLLLLDSKISRVSYFQYVKDYLFPVLNLVGINLPLILFFTLKKFFI